VTVGRRERIPIGANEVTALGASEEMALGRSPLAPVEPAADVRGGQQAMRRGPATPHVRIYDVGSLGGSRGTTAASITRVALGAQDRAIRLALILWSHAAPGRERRDARPNDVPADRDLARAMAQGDERALARVYDRYATFAYAVALRACGDRADSEEAVVDGFLDLWRAAPRFAEDRGTLAAWLATMVRNRAIDRRRQRARRCDDGDLDRHDLSSDGPDVALSADIRSAIASLRPRQRAVLELAYFGGLTQREIAVRLGIPIGSVKSATWRGLEALRGRLGGVDAD
jgi:RNA polymerase sigma-70 factor (ECF subfamily)